MVDALHTFIVTIFSAEERSCLTINVRLRCAEHYTLRKIVEQGERGLWLSNLVVNMMEGFWSSLHYSSFSSLVELGFPAESHNLKKTENEQMRELVPCL